MSEHERRADDDQGPEIDAFDEVAIVGLAGRFPGAQDVASLWQNLRQGVESIRRFSAAELAAGKVPAAQLGDPRYVPARGVLAGIEGFDAGLFAMSPREAAVTDPQHRLLLECAWEALETAAIDPDTYPGRIGLFAGSVLSTYLLFHLLPRAASEEGWPLVLANDKDTLCTRVSYKLNLRGPSVSVQTACSTALVAVHLARQALLDYDCDVALAGGVTVRTPQTVGYLYQEDGILSPDGHCRPFDAAARGTVFGSGAGLVVLKRLSDARAAGDPVRAVVKSSAINNDGAAKAGFTAPSLEGQAEVVARALAAAEIDPETIGFVEAHGTGTPLGDPIEVQALSRAFRAAGARRRGFCALGSLKGNLGHLDVAAGIAGLAKAVLALEHGEVPPTLHFTVPNPHLELAESPFYVPATLTPWERGEGPRRAAVSSLGIGGTNAHVVLEEAPPPPATSPSRPWQLLLLAARSATAVEAMATRLADHLEADPGRDLADVAYTLQVGRRRLGERRAVVAAGRAEALAALREPARQRTGRALDGSPELAFVFPGQGAQRAGQGAALYAAEPVFRREVDRGAEHLAPLLGEDLRALLFAPEAQRAVAEERLADTALTQPALFLLEVALARLWMSWGLVPRALLGHSVGEYVAAHLAGVMSFEDALALVAERGRMIAALPPGAMLAVPLDEAALAPRLSGGLAVAVVNAADRVVVAGEEAAVEALRQELATEGVEARRLRTSHAFHSPLLEPVVEPFRRRVAQLALAPPQVPFLSNVSGGWITAEEATDPAYWARHLRQTVRFGAGLAALAAEPNRVLLEVGPGRGLTRLARRWEGEAGRRLPAFASFGDDDSLAEPAAVLGTLGALWTQGLEPDWRAYYGEERRRRLALPTYPFERRRLWIEPADPAAPPAGLAWEGLEGPAAAAGPGQGPEAAPLAPHEEAVAAVWREVLGLAQLAAGESFFDLGGDSLIALQVVARLRQRLGVETPVQLLFENPTLGAFATAVAARQAASSTAALPPLRVTAATAPAPLSSSQRRLWFLDQLEPGNPAYNLRYLLELDGRLDVAALVAAFAWVCGRHAVLRSTFTVCDGEPEQRLASAAGADGRAPAALGRNVVDLGGLPPAVRVATAERLAQAGTGRGFDLARGPLVRLLLLRRQATAHDLALAVHHIASDGWSMGILLREVAAAYGAWRAGTAPALPPLPAQFADFARWQAAWLAGPALAADLAFWRQALAGAPAGLELPADRPPPARRSLAGLSVPVAIDAATTAALAGLARTEGASPFMALLAVFASQLRRATGERDLTIGTPVAGRPLPELEALVGLFVNTLVLRADLGGDPSFRTLLGRLRATTLAAFEHQAMPFERLVEELQPERDLGRNPLFQVMFALHNTPLPSLALGAEGLRLATRELASRTAMFDLTLALAERDGRLVGSLEVAADLFDRATAERWAGHFGRLLAAAVASPDQRLWELPVLTPEEEAQLRGWLARPQPFALTATLDRRLAHWLAATPEAIAVVAGEEALSYGELGRRAWQVAAALRAEGVGPDVPVGLYVGRRVELAVGITAVLLAGGAYLPLDASYPPSRLAAMLADAAAPVLLAGEEPRGELAAVPRMIRLDRPAPGPAPPLPPADLELDHLAYVIYTSGSTGRPKGVACTHRGALNLLADLDRRRPLVPGEAAALWTSISFDVSVWEVFAALAYGGTLVVPGEEERVRAEALLPWLAARAIRSAYLPPFLLSELLARVSAPAAAPHPLARLLVGVEPIREPVLSGLAAALPGLTVVNGYGPTEATVCATFYDVGRAPAPERKAPLGLPVANCRVALLGADLELVPVGIPGEVWIGGAGLARGYLGRPGLTADRFMPDPLAGSPGGGPAGGRCYRSGDLARRHADGNLEFLGRRDQQVKVRGHRIELAEVEAALTRLPGVREAAVAVRPDPRGEGQLVAFVVAPAGGAELDDWRQALRQALPDAMVPAALVRLAALPLTPSSKLDRRALPAPDWAAAGTSTGEAPRGAVEGLLAELFAELLGRERVSAGEDFFSLGGHSLLGIRLVSRLREVFHVELPVRRLFEAPTVAGLAAVIAELRRGGQPEAPPIEPCPRQDGEELPLAFAQQRLWIVDQLSPGNPAYNIPAAVRLGGELRVAALRQVFATIAGRHEVLRTSFPATAGRPRLEVRPRWRPPLPVVDLAALPGTARAATLDTLARREARRPFDLARGPLFRLALLRLAAADHALLMTCHHIIADGWSMGLLEREVASLYAALVAGETSPLAPLPVQYADFAAWQRAWLQGEVLVSQLAYWRAQLAGAPQRLELPTDRPRPLAPTYRGASRPLVISAELTAGLDALGRRLQATRFITLASLWAGLLGRAAQQDELVVGIPIANRNRRETEGLIGFFVNALALRVDLGGAPTLAALVARVRQSVLGAFAHQDLPFEQLVAEIAPNRDLASSPLFQATFSLEEAPLAGLALPGLTLAPIAQGAVTAKFELSLTLRPAAGGLRGQLEHDADLFDATTIERLKARLLAWLAAAAVDPETPLAALPWLLAGERQQVLCEVNDAASAFPRAAGLSELFAVQAARAPEAAAVIDETATWSYHRLAATAGGLGRRLADLGVGPGDLVGVAMERSAELVASLLGILAAGAAYVPLDPGYPDARLLFMLADTQATVILVHARTRQRLEALLAAHPEVRERLVPVDEEVAALAARPVATDLPLVKPASSLELAYVIYTSGSTGRPKGVAVPQQAVVRLVRDTNYVHLGPGDRLAHLSNISFDAATFEIWGALLNGGGLVVISKEVTLSPAVFVARLRATGVTAMGIATALFHQMVREEPGAFGFLRDVLFGGDAADPRALALAQQGGAACRLLNCYGPTECTAVATYHEVGPVGPDLVTVPIGLPIGNTSAYVADRSLGALALGEPGELLLGGEGLARGYLRRPAATAERFVPHPWGAPGERLYRSGDLVRRRADGALEFLGRIDHQVKVRGFRIELGEIQAALAEHPAVAEVVVLARADGPGEKRLVAYLVARPGVVLEAATLRDFLAEKLPPFMVPAAFVGLDALPVSANGKLDLKALPAPVWETAEAAVEEPASGVEATLAAIWAQVLGVERVGPRDNFFELGGDSILSIQVVSRAQQAGLAFGVRDLFQHQTVAELAAVVRPSAASDEAVEVDGEVPLLPIQRWFFDLDVAAPGHFNQSLLLTLSEPVEGARLERALGLLARRHTALRCRYEQRADGRWRQYSGTAPTPLLRVDLSGLGAAESAAVEALAARLQASLDLTAGPLWRAALFQLSGTAQRLFLVLHHLIVDGVSWRILLGDLELAYRGLAAAAVPALPAVPQPLAGWAARLAAEAGSAATRAELPYWSAAEGRLPPPLAPAATQPTTADWSRADQPPPTDVATVADFGTVAAAASHTVELDEETTRALVQEVPAATRASTLDALLLALTQALGAADGGSASGRPAALWLHLEGHGRDEAFPDADASRTVGWLTALYPVLLSLDGRERTPGEQLRTIKEQLRAVPRGGLGYGLLRYLGEAATAERLAAIPAPEVVFNYLGQLDRGLAGSSLFAPAAERGGPPRAASQRRTHLLEINGGVSGGRLRLTWTYPPERLARATVEGWGARFRAALAALIAHCRAPAEAAPGPTAFTPTDFPQARVSQKDLDTLMKKIGRRPSPAAPKGR